MTFSVPYFDCDNLDVKSAFRIAVGDVLGNIQPYQGPRQAKPVQAILAGLDYDRPWTRDAAINSWNGASLLFPTAARQTLESVLESDENQQVRIGGQYWDAIIWATGAWQHFLCSGDTDFLKTAAEVVVNSLRYFESTEFDEQDGLFRGAACYGDGVSAYPDEWAVNTGEHTGILDWPRFNPDDRINIGYGIPMKTLSTNCLYYQAYRIAAEMAEVMGVGDPAIFIEKAEKMKMAINHRFWDEAAGRYKYLVSPLGDSDHQEGLGHAFAILFGVADAQQRQKIFENQYIAPSGIPCVWPNFPRYMLDKNAFGRQCGPVWPHVQGFWARAAALHQKNNIFDHEFFRLTEFANRDSHFTEIYHPETGEIYGGLQEKIGGIGMYKSCRRQTWSATGYLSMVLFGLVGMRIRKNGIDFEPYLPKNMTHLEIGPFFYRQTLLTVRLSGSGRNVRKVSLNGAAVAEPYLPGDMNGQVVVDIEL
ncbi:hypothetical protein KAH55_11425 [bacterium]|nr:hypothetical protein [bacterium]